MLWMFTVVQKYLQTSTFSFYTHPVRSLLFRRVVVKPSSISIAGGSTKRFASFRQEDSVNRLPATDLSAFRNLSASSPSRSLNLNTWLLGNQGRKANCL